MKNLIRLSDYTKNDVKEIFHIADEIQQGNYKDFLRNKTIVMFFPESSIRTRVTFEKGIYLLGGQSVLFSPETLDKKEDIKDVISYLNNWTDGIVVRYKDISMLDQIAKYAKMPVINAMTDINHPCEMLVDLYALSKIRKDFTADRFLFVGAKGNIGLAWREASRLMGFSMEQCCPKGYEMSDIPIYHNIEEAIAGKDIICTDSLSKNDLAAFADYQITFKRMQLANGNALLNPCPPFFRGEEVSVEVVDSQFFVGYEFKKHLLEIQQAILIFSMLN
ncbi:ornithine carbamoyltransferase [Konateibacter massiliensis]|uniref:ornithine carbamoyltransferase n=1 Tax=Konateibacter massiliensis TaxID=2002841 RepID=UPI000C15869C|nr:peptide transporter [Konateibacter massiliensis]